MAVRHTAVRCMIGRAPYGRALHDRVKFTLATVLSPTKVGQQQHASSSRHYLPALAIATTTTHHYVPLFITTYHYYVS